MIFVTTHRSSVTGRGGCPRGRCQLPSWSGRRRGSWSQWRTRAMSTGTDTDTSSTHQGISLIIILHPCNIVTGKRTEFQMTMTLTQAGNDYTCTNIMWIAEIIPLRIQPRHITHRCRTRKTVLKGGPRDYILEDYVPPNQ